MGAPPKNTGTVRKHRRFVSETPLGGGRPYDRQANTESPGVASRTPVRGPVGVVSVEMMTLVIGLDPEAIPSPQQRSVLLLLANRADEEGLNAWPSQARLAAESSLSERTVRRQLSDLRKAEVIHANGKGGVEKDVPNDKRPVRYDLNVPWLLGHQRGDTVTSRSADDHAAVVESGGQTDPPRGDTLTGAGGQSDRQTVLEPSIEPTTTPAPSGSASGADEFFPERTPAPTPSPNGRVDKATRDALFDAVRRAWDIPDGAPLTESQRKRIARGVRELVAVPDASPDEIRKRSNRMRHAKSHLRGKIDPQTLTGNWGSFAEEDRR